MSEARDVAARAALDGARLREEFPILRQQVRGRRLVYLDNAATTQKPRRVLEAIVRFYETSYANVHRGVYALSERATAAYESARETVRRFLNASRPEEIVFVRGTTEAINLVAHGFGRAFLKGGDEILVTHMEHHSNIVPWQLACEATGARLRVAPIDDRGELILEALERLLGPRTRIVAVAHVSNALGTVNPIHDIVALARARGIPVLVDGAQAVPHLRVDVRALGCDFYCFSGHKVYGPSGIGVLYGAGDWLERLPPYQGGGEMIRTVTFERTTFARAPQRFEAGTPHVAGAVGLAAALGYLEELGLERVAAHEAALLARAAEALSGVPGLRRIGNPREACGLISFVIEGIHPHDVGTVLDHEGIAIRAGHHCAQPLMARYGVPATVRASFGVYNTFEDIERLVQALGKVHEVFG